MSGLNIGSISFANTCKNIIKNFLYLLGIFDVNIKLLVILIYMIYLPTYSWARGSNEETIVSIDGYYYFDVG